MGDEIKKSKEKKPKKKKEKKEKKFKEKKEKKSKEKREKTKDVKDLPEFDAPYILPNDAKFDIIEEPDFETSIDVDLQDEPDITFAAPIIDQQGLKVVESREHSSSSSSSDSEDENALPTENNDGKG